MAEQVQGNSVLSAAVADVAHGVALALGEGGSYALSGVLVADEAVALAAIRVLGADVLAPYAATRQAARGREDESMVRGALAAYPRARALPTSRYGTTRGWWKPPGSFCPAAPGRPRSRSARNGSVSLPGRRWRTAPRNWRHCPCPAWPPRSPRHWPPVRMTWPGDSYAPYSRRDWLQAAGVGRWLARTDVPASLGLESGLAFVRHMSRGDARVSLHISAARRFRGPGS